MHSVIAVYLKKLNFHQILNFKKLIDMHFLNLHLKKIIVPSSVTLINESAFFACLNLTSFEIPNDSKLELIHEFAFYSSQIKCFYIPRHVTQINKNAFFQCSSLQKDHIPNDSELQIIHDFAFYSTEIGSFSYQIHL